MTKRQREVLNFIMAYQVEHSMAPTLREIGGHFGWSSSASPSEHVYALQRKGYLGLSRYGSRSIVVLDAGKAEFVCSKCGATPSRGSQ